MAEAIIAERDLLDVLKRIAENERCRECECLQGAAVQLMVDTSDAAVHAEARALRVERSRLHPCDGCEPCPPADSLVVYRARRSGGEAQPGNSCPNCGCA